MRNQITVAETCRRYGIARQDLLRSTNACSTPTACTRWNRRRDCRRPPRRGPRSWSRKILYGCARPISGRAPVQYTPISAAPERRMFPPYQRFTGCCNAIRSSPRTQRRAVPQWRRLERYAPNDLWQIDGTQVLLADESPAWVVDILDAERALRHRRDGHQPVHFQQRLAGLEIRQLGSAGAPADVRQVRALSQHLEGLLLDHSPAGSIEELRALCDQFRWHYNHQRSHQSLGQQLPGEVYQAPPKAHPITSSFSTAPPGPSCASGNSGRSGHTKLAVAPPSGAAVAAD